MSFLYNSLQQSSDTSLGTSLGIWLKARRRILSLTRTQVAEQTNYSVAMLKKVELGQRKPSRELATQLIEVLKVPLELHQAFFTSAHSGIVAPELAPLSRVSLPHLPTVSLLNVAGIDAWADEAEPATPPAPSVRELPPARYASLPYAPCPLVGRDDDIDAVLTLLAHPDHRLVTLVGAPGVGKTQLALAVAGRVRDTEAGKGPGRQNIQVGFVSLAEEQDAERLPMLIGEALGLEWLTDLQTAKATSTHIPTQTLQTLLSLLQNQSCLIVLDSIEPLRDTDAFVALIHALLSPAPAPVPSGQGIQVLLTSRIALHLSSESIYWVSPLAVPQFNEATSMVSWQHVASLKLLLNRILFYNPHFQVNPANVRAAAVLCVQLDGLPLALELAAARSKTLNLRLLLEPLQPLQPHLYHPTQQLATGSGRSILALLAHGPRDLPERQRSLTNAIGWSYQRLSVEEQRAFETLACFEHGFTYELAAEVDISVEMVEALAAHSLLEMETLPNDELRFHMLRVIREYARVQMESRRPVNSTRHQTAYSIKSGEVVWAR